MIGEKGLDSEKFYPSVVVGVSDPLKLGRIQARPAKVFDGIADGDLPWCIPMWDHPDGASSESGILIVPKVGSKVNLKFQDGKMSHPYYCGYNVDTGTTLIEASTNYPNRAVLRFKSGMCVVVDTTTNDIYIQCPGDAKVVVGGNLDLTVLGNMTTRVSGDSALSVNGSLKAKASSITSWSSGASLHYGMDYQVYGMSTAVTSATILNMNGLAGGIDLDSGGAPGPAPKPSIPSDSLPSMPRGVQAQDWTDS